MLYTNFYIFTIGILYNVCYTFKQISSCFTKNLHKILKYRNLQQL